ncbi:acylphosphatase [Sulfurivirga sp.]|uniref:acylphosphatase n=1 Tax=Sulfurivirga sp. TaxID=2614236 RepID=UPI0025F6639F|nr:acylphosphatase [Sulfurivirga sp.]
MTSHEENCLRAIIHGRVQGVFFRASTQKKARALGLTGWVRNLPDGTVEVLAVGPRPALEALLDWLHEGPPLARVERVDAAWAVCSKHFEGFEILA